MSVPEESKRWMDRDDVIQDILMEAVDTEATFSASGGRKFSTYLYSAIDWYAAHTYVSLNRKKRRAEQLVELDAPLLHLEDTAKFEVPVPATQGNEENDVRSFITLCRNLTQPALVALVHGFLRGNGRKATPEICAEIASVTVKLGLDSGSLVRIGKSEESSRNVLTTLSRDVIMSLETEAALRILECVGCKGTFTIAAIREGRFHVGTMTCRTCYRELKKLPSILSCFGKVQTDKRQGYSEEDTACKVHCQDRKQCVQFQQKEEGKSMSKNAAVESGVDNEDIVDDLEDVDLGEVEAKKGKAVAPKDKPKKAVSAKANKPVAKTKTVGVAKKAKNGPQAAVAASAKKAAAKVKPIKEDDDRPCPKDVGPHWPYRAGSQRRYAFQLMYDGIDKEAFSKQCKKDAVNERGLLVAMRGSGPREFRTTHTWKVNEEGTRYKIYDIKYIGGDKQKTGAKGAKKTEAKVTAAAKKKAA